MTSVRSCTPLRVPYTFATAQDKSYIDVSPHIGIANFRGHEISIDANHIIIPRSKALQPDNYLPKAAPALAEAAPALAEGDAAPEGPDELVMTMVALSGTR